MTGVSEAVREASTLLRPGGTMLIGELHGTYEYPALVAGLAATAAHQRIPVVVGLELPRTEQDRVDTFLDSDGRPADAVSLTASSF